MKKLLPPTYFCIYIVAAVLLHSICPITEIIHPPYTYLGLVPIAFGVILNLWTDNLFKKQSTTVKPFEKPAALILNGPFRLSRHPMYLGFVVALIGAAVILGDLTPFLAPIAMFITCEALFIPQEEKNLEQTFGQKYKDYKTHIRCWI